MTKKTVKFEDFMGSEEEEFYFNLKKAELLQQKKGTEND